MIAKTAESKLGSRARVTFWDPKTGERVPATNAETGEEVWGGEWHANMITDAGLDIMGSRGTSTNVNIGSPQFHDPNFFMTHRLTISSAMPNVKEQSGAVTAEQSGTLVTASAAFFEAEDVGRAIVWADGSNARITAYNSATSVTVDKTQTVAAQVFERWRTDISSVPSPIGFSTTGGYDGFTFNHDEDNVYFIRRGWRQYELVNNANVTGFAMGQQSPNDCIIVENIRDPSGNPITVSILAGKAIRVDHEMRWRVARANRVLTLHVDEYDAADQLIGSESYEVDFWPYVQGLRTVSAQWLAVVINPTQTGVSTSGSSAAGAVATAQGWGTRFLSNRDATPGDIESFAGPTDTIPTSSGMMGLVTSEYVPGERRKTRLMVGAANYGNGDVYGIRFANGTQTTGADPEAGFMMQLREGEGPIVKEPTHTLAFGYELSWDRDYTIE